MDKTPTILPPAPRRTVEVVCDTVVRALCIGVVSLGWFGDKLGTLEAVAALAALSGVTLVPFLKRRDQGTSIAILAAAVGASNPGAVEHAIHSVVRLCSLV